MEKAVIYARVSSEEQAKHGFSIENQKRQCEEFAQRNDYYGIKTFVVWELDYKNGIDIEDFIVNTLKIKL